LFHNQPYGGGSGDDIGNGLEPKPIDGSVVVSQLGFPPPPPKKTNAKADAGIDLVALDGTLYDQMLDTTTFLGLVPKRFEHLTGRKCVF
jgi:hypothetical protein